MSTITLYTTGCPKCKILEKKLEAAGVKYDVVTDEATILNVCDEIGAEFVPILEVNGQYYDFAAAIKWVGEYNA